MLWWLALAWMSPAALAQEEVALPSAIPEVQITPEASFELRNVRMQQERLLPSAFINRIEERLPQVGQGIGFQEEKAAKALAEADSLQNLERLEAQWAVLQRDLPVWRGELTTRITQIEAAIESLDETTVKWEATRRSLFSRGGSGALVSIAAEVLEAVVTTRNSADLRRNELLTLQSSVASEEARVTRGLDAIAEAREVLVGRIFERERGAIWAPEVREQLSTDLSLRIKETLRSQQHDVVLFARENAAAIWGHLGIFAALCVLFLLARQRVRRRTEEEEGLSRVSEVFEFPIAASLLVAILLAPWVYDYRPQALIQILGAAVLLPTIVILRRFTTRQMLPLLNALVFFYFFDRIRESAAALPFVSRLLFLTELVAGILILAWLFRPHRLTQIPAYAARNAVLRFLGVAGRVSLVALTLAFGAEILGFSRLANLVGNAVFGSAYVGVVLFASVRILESLVTFALRVQPLGALGAVRHQRYTIARRIQRAIVFGAALFWALATLEFLAIRRPLLSLMRDLLLAQIKIGSITISPGDVLAFGIAIWASFLFSRFAGFILKEDVYPRLSLGRGVPYAVSTFTHYAILLLGFFLAVAATEIDLNRFAILAGAFGVGIGFGLQNVVNNFVSGLILLSERPIQVGDTIESAGVMGEVKRIGIRSSTVRTWNGAELIIPNSELISERVINWTLSDRERRIDFPVGVAYGTDPQVVIDLLLEVGQAIPDVLDSPAPHALFRGFGDSSLDFELRAWTGHVDQMAEVQSQLALEVHRALDAAGIEIPFPQRDLHLRNVADAALPGLGTPGKASEL